MAKVQIETLKDLEKLIKLCKKQGIATIKVDGIEFTLSPEAQARLVKRANRPIEGLPMPGVEKIETPDDLTAEELLFYSSGGPGPVVGS